jgi:acyl dehydratase
MVTFEDFHVGDVADCGSVTIDREELLDFARKFDPQPIHIDEDAAQKSIYGGLIASGWHVIALGMRLVVDRLLADGPDSGSLGSPGADEIRWLKPARAGDTLTMRTEVIETIPSRSRPDRGVVKLRYRMRNQHGEDVMTMIGIGMFKRRVSG